MYSASVWADPQLYALRFDAVVRRESFLESFRRRSNGERIVFPIEVEQAFLETRDPELEAIRDLLLGHRLAQIQAADREIASQSARLEDAKQRLANKPAKGAGHSQRMATQKIEAARRRKDFLTQGPAQWHVGRMFPGSHVPVLTMENGQLVVRSMRYQCRPSQIERRMEPLLETAHHARRDSLESRWRGEFGFTHGVIAAESFFESIALHRLEGRQLAPGENLATMELEFIPSPRQTMFVACVWSHWQRPGQPDLRCFASVVDRAPVEIRATGQEWCPVFLEQEQVAAWLNPDPANLPASQALLDDRPDVRFEFERSSSERERLARPSPVKIINLWKPTLAIDRSASTAAID